MRSVIVDFSQLFAPLKNADWYGNADGMDPDDSEMADWSGDHETLTSDENAENLRALVEFLVRETGRTDLEVDQDLAERGKAVALNGEWNGSLSGTSCVDCHDTLGEAFDPMADGGGDYPDIAGYLSAEWLRDFIANPGEPQHYGDRNHMPAYAEVLNNEELDLLVRWMTGDFYQESK